MFWWMSFCHLHSPHSSQPTVLLWPSALHRNSSWGAAQTSPVRAWVTHVAWSTQQMAMSTRSWDLHCICTPNQWKTSENHWNNMNHFCVHGDLPNPPSWWKKGLLSYLHAMHCLPRCEQVVFVEFSPRYRKTSTSKRISHSFSWFSIDFPMFSWCHDVSWMTCIFDVFCKTKTVD